MNPFQVLSLILRAIISGKLPAFRSGNLRLLRQKVRFCLPSCHKGDHVMVPTGTPYHEKPGIFLAHFTPSEFKEKYEMGSIIVPRREA